MPTTKTLRLAAAAIAAPLLLISTAHAAGPATPPPATEKRPVTDTHHGQAITDDYRWLEDWNDPAVKAWSEAQNTYARAYLDNLPAMAKVRARVSEIMTAPRIGHGALHMAGKRLLAIRRDSSRQQPMLVAFDDAAAVLSGGKAEPRILLDPAAAKDKAAIDWYVPSPDGELVAVSISLAGSESGDVHILRVADGKEVGEVVPRVNGGTAGGSLAWMPDGKGFFYTRYPRAGERPEADLSFYTQVYSHRLGTDSKDDRYEVGKDFPKIAEIILEAEPATAGGDGQRGGAVLASVQNGDGGEFVHLLRDPKTGQWTQIDQYTDRIVQATLGPDRALYMVSRKDAPRGQLLRLELPKDGAPKLADAKVIVPEGTDTLVSEFAEAANLCVTDKFVYATYQLGGPSEVRVFDHAGKAAGKPAQAPVASAGGLARLGGDRVAFEVTTYIAPTTWFAAAPEPGGQTSATVVDALSTHTPFDFSAYEAVREMATSKDGTKVPVNIVRRKGWTAGAASPCVLTGYGGYGVNIEPGFNPADRVLLEQGFVLAEANIRGGGEFGEAWHRAGNLENKQNVFDDFAAAARMLIDRKYTSADKLAVEGGSNGGLLMGAMLTQHPDMVRCVVSHVGIYDMLRVELSPNGAFNVPEFGTVKDKKLFEAMHAYSPYHRVKDGTAYPAVLFMTGANDPRVDPMQSRKMTARLQAAIAGVQGAGPVLLRTSGDTGHGMGTPLKERIAQAADAMSFIMTHLGVTPK